MRADTIIKEAPVNMKATVKNTEMAKSMRTIMNRAWMLVKKYGFTLSEALKQSWRICKVKFAMTKRVVKFHYTKINGEIREAWGTLSQEFMPLMNTTDSGRRQNDTLVTYYDKEKDGWRCFKIANFLDMVG